MVNYQLGKIYKIVSGNLKYIGSTCEPTLARRMVKHRSDFRWWEENKSNYLSSFKVIEKADACIVLIENFPCNSRDELQARERYHIENNVCVNIDIPYRTEEE
jgi:hypothetical protein